MEIGFICNDLYDSNCPYTRRDANFCVSTMCMVQKNCRFYLSSG